MLLYLRLSLMSLLILVGAPTLAREYTWEKFGYTNRPFFPQGKAPLFSAAQNFCSAFSGGGLSHRACLLPETLSVAAPGWYCISTDFPCGEANIGASIADGPLQAIEVCTNSANPTYTGAKGAVGKVAFNASVGKCSCFDANTSKPEPKFFPDLDTGLCYQPPLLQVELSRNRYKPSEADQPINIDISVVRGGTLMPNVAIQLKVITDEGAPGTLSATSGFTDANTNNYLGVRYTFPDFTKKKVDKIIVSCEICGDDFNPTTLEITMSPTLVGFFNGVWNTEKQANDGLNILKFETEELRGKVSTAYDLFYNQSGCGRPGTTCLQDIAEVFEQRSKELDGVIADRWENFWDLLAGRHASPQSGTGGLLSALGNPALALAQLFDATFNAMLAQIASGWAQMLSNPPTGADNAAHLAKLQRYASDDFTMVLIAHSQGNLFVNTAYDGIRSSHPQAAAKVVHVAPASPTLRGNYVLADIDLVINGLRLQGVTSVPSANLGLPYSTTDASGHMLVATYMDATRSGLERVKSMIKTALESL